MSSVWYEYDLYKCEGGISNRSCEFTGEMGGFQDETDTNSLSVYFQGLTMYTLINFGGIVLIILGTLIYICGQLCYCCINKSAQVHPVSIMDKKFRPYIMASIMALFLAFFSIVLMLGMILGYDNSTAMYTSVPDAPKGATEILRNQMPIIENTIILFSSMVVGNTITRLNTSITNAVNFPQIQTDLNLINETLTKFPTSTYIRSLTDALETNVDTDIIIMDNITTYVTIVEGQLADLSNATSTLRDNMAASAANTVLQDNLAVTEVAVGNFDLIPLRKSVVNLQLNMVPLDGLIDDLNDLVTDISTYLDELLVPLEDLLVTQVQGINDTLVDTSTLNTEDMYVDFNKSISDSKSDTNEISNQLDDAKVSLAGVNIPIHPYIPLYTPILYPILYPIPYAGVNFTDYLLTIDNANVSMTAAVENVDFTALNFAFQFPTYATLINLTTYIGLLDDVLTEIDNVDLR